jgi:GNAT superfamily N-acetyltransferase
MPWNRLPSEKRSVRTAGSRGFDGAKDSVVTSRAAVPDEFRSLGYLRAVGLRGIGAMPPPSRTLGRSPRERPPSDSPHVRIVPLTPARWPELQRLFGRSATTDGCQCMWFFQTSTEYRAGYGAANRTQFRARVGAGAPPGLLAYLDDDVAGWCALGPKDSYSRYTRSRLFGGAWAPGTWAIVCFYVPSDRRGHGLMQRLIAAGVEFAREHGAERVEGYPVVVARGARADASRGYHGFLGPFQRNGFRVVARPSDRRAMVRRELSGSRFTRSPDRRGADGRRGAPSTERGSPRASRGRPSTGA